MNHYLTEDQIEELIYIEDDYERAHELVKILFKEKRDKEGFPYIGHLERVSNRLINQDTKVAGLLHDVVEDVEFFTFEDLKKLNFSDKTIEIVKLVTNDFEEPDRQKFLEAYHNKITKILESGNDEAILLKHSDMTDNYDPKRLAKLDEKTRDRLTEKYGREYDRLTKKVEEIIKRKGD